VTLDEIKEVLEKIERTAEEKDFETAHCLEDGLYIDVLTAIADGAANAQELAKEALKAAEMKHTRWYA
jgi:hypothetical protein